MSDSTNIVQSYHYKPIDASRWKPAIKDAVKRELAALNIAPDEYLLLEPYDKPKSSVDGFDYTTVSSVVASLSGNKFADKAVLVLTKEAFAQKLMPALQSQNHRVAGAGAQHSIP